MSSLPYLDLAAGRGIKPGLARIRSLLRTLGNPEKEFRSIHVAGTNGKGSVCAMLESILREAGHRTGLYTSPHLIDVRERITVRGKPIPLASLRRWTDSIRSVAGKLEPELTYFEILTAAAFLHFKDANIEIGIIETGLGGRLDSTNVLEKPEACVITNIGLEHTEYLGETIGKIAGEKAGILKSGVPCVTGTSGAALAVIREKAKKSGSEIHAVRPNASLKGCALNAEYQKENIALVLKTVKVLREKGWKIPGSAVRKGLKNVQWQGRFERREVQVGRKSVPVILDGAHNADGIRALVDSIRHTAFGRKKCLLVFNALKDKQAETMAKALSFLNLHGVMIPRLETDRAFAVSEVRGFFSRFSPETPAFLLDSVANCWKMIRAGNEKNAPDWICAAGSLYLVGETLKTPEFKGQGKERT